MAYDQEELNDKTTMIGDLFVKARLRTWLHHFGSLHGQRVVLLVLFVFFSVASAAYLHRVPGLIGDEGLEGEHAYQLLRGTENPLLGINSYISVWTDYLRLPFLTLFGTSALAVRLPMFLFSFATFWLAWAVLQKLFGARVALIALTLALFSPPYLLYQRLGWEWTLFPFFALLTLALLMHRGRHAPLLAGMSAGLGASTHVLFIATVVGLLISWVLRFVRRPRELLFWWPFIPGFMAVFGFQLAILSIHREDQPPLSRLLATLPDRLMDVPAVLTHFLSGSAYVALYTGHGLNIPAMQTVTGVLLLLCVAAVFLGERKKQARAWALGIAIGLFVATVMIDHHAMRYFFLFTLGVWTLAGVGLGKVLSRVQTIASFPHISAITLALLLLFWSATQAFVPYLKTGGSDRSFSFGSRTNTAADFADIRLLVACLRTTGTVYAVEPQIRNRLVFLSHGNPDISITDNAEDARWLVEYGTRKTERDVGGTAPCPTLKHFRIIEHKRFKPT
jgi:dolichyl-phosphate-mannose-protein mannosyltransferase